MARNTKIVVAVLLVGALFLAAIFYLASARSAAQTAEAIRAPAMPGFRSRAGSSGWRRVGSACRATLPGRGKGS